MITKEEARVFLGMVSDVGNESCISHRGKKIFFQILSVLFISLSRISKSNA
jgi:hypothetical protein